MRRTTTTFTATLLTTLGAALAALAGDADAPALPRPTAQHAWLERLAGEWDAECEITMEPGQPPVQSTARESVRLIGGFWAQAEFTGQAMGSPFTGVLTLGYDPQQQRYVGTWIDSLGSQLWQYHGALDAAGKRLTLLTEGRCEAAGEVCEFRETIELVGPDEKTFTSERKVNGEFVTFMRVRYTRHK